MASSPTRASLRGRVERERADRDHRRRMARRAAHQCVQARAQFLHVERLRQVVVGAGFEADHFVLPVRARGENQNRQAAAEPAQRLDHRDAVAFRQAEVDDGRVVFELASEVDAFVTVGGCVDDVARILEILDELGAQPRIVFDHQHAHRLTFELISSTVSLRLPCESTETVLTRPPSSSTRHLVSVAFLLHRHDATVVRALHDRRRLLARICRRSRSRCGRDRPCLRRPADDVSVNAAVSRAASSDRERVFMVALCMAIVR